MSTTTTSIVTMHQQTSTILLSSSPVEPDSNSRVVRFDSECVLIPEPSKRPKLSKTYSLPLWKKRPSDSEAEAASSSSRVSLSPEETHVVIKVPIPRFISRSPSRGRGTSASPPTHKPLSPCLVNRIPSSLPSPSIPRAMRRTSLPISKPKDDALTVPLRACCADCVPITEECLKEGAQWQEKFSRGARRRRSASLDNSDRFGSCSGPSSASGSTCNTVGFAAVVANDAHGADIGHISNPRFRTSGFAITVDEVDKRRKSQEHTEEELSQFRSPSSSPRTSPAFHSPTGPYSPPSYPVPRRAPEREGSASSTSSSVSELSFNDLPPRRPKTSPIQEEDEDQLFPLPSPRRSPNNSPSPSKSSTPSPSPNASTSCLPAAAASKDSLSQGSSTSDDVLAKSLSRKMPSPGNGYLSPSSLPPAALNRPSNLSITAPVHTRAATDPETLGREPSRKPQLLPLTISTSPQARSPRPLPSPPPVLGNSSSLSTSPIASKLRPLPVPSSPRSPTTPTHPVSSSPKSLLTSRSPSSPSIPTKRRPSFKLPAIKDAIKGASADVLRGVSSMGGGGVVGSV